MNQQYCGLVFIAGVTIAAAAAFTGCRHKNSGMEAAPEMSPSAATSCPTDGDAVITALLEPIRKKHNVPALCAAVLSSDGLVAIGAVGTRRIDAADPVTTGDLWHLGSCTKAMTASLLGRLVEQGAVRWESTLAEIFPELASTMQAELKAVTVIQLLAHRSGLEENYDWQSFSTIGTVGQQRAAVVQKAVSEKPRYTPGQAYHYSNLGYVVAGAVIEKLTGSPWEDRIKTLLFDPLQMTSAGFGGVGTPGRFDQPWGHHNDGKPAAANGPDMDNPPVLGPAGRVHCTTADWAKFVIDQLNGAMGKPALLKPDTYKMIQTPPFGDEYALGWGVVRRDWGKGTVLTHGGSNTMNFANVWVAPNGDFAVLVCVNQGGDTAFAASDDAVSALIGAFLP